MGSGARRLDTVSAQDLPQGLCQHGALLHGGELRTLHADPLHQARKRGGAQVLEARAQVVRGRVLVGLLQRLGLDAMGQQELLHRQVKEGLVVRILLQQVV
jgi:hypothetical protein